MSISRPHVNLHGARHTSPASAQHFHDQPDDLGLQDTSVPAPAAAHITTTDFPFPFASLPEQSPSVGFGDQYSHFSHHRRQHHDVASHPLAAPAFRACSSENSRSSPGASESTQDRNSPLANSFEDPGAEDLGIPARGDGTDLGGKIYDDKNGATPAWTELKTKAGKDRKRLPLACIACRRKKIRCSGEKPACKHCQRSRIPCVYKVTTRKAAPRTDYMAMLDKRLKRMEERIIKIVPKAEQRGSSPVVRAVVKPQMPPTGPPTRPSVSRKRGLEEAFGARLEAWAKTPSKAKFPSAGASEAAPAEVHKEEESRLSREGFDALPPKNIQEHLAEVYFDNVYGQAYLLLHKPNYMRKLRNDALPPVLVLSVCAVAARFTPSPNIGQTSRPCLRGEEWASHARDICTRRYEWPNITILTCLLILSLHEFGTCHGGRSWALGGQAIRMAFALQLHKDIEYDPLCRTARTPLSFVDREIRRRIMWACFMMDRFNSSGSDRPMFIMEESIRIPLPVAERNFQLDMPAHTEFLDGTKARAEKPQADSQLHQPGENMGVAAFIIRSIAIWGRIVTYLNQGGKDMDPHPMWSSESSYAKLVNDIDNLSGSLSERLQYSPTNLHLQATENTASQFLLLHLSIQQNNLFLNHAAAVFAKTRAGPDAPKDFSSHAASRTLAAANRISEILGDSEKSQCCISAPFSGYCAFSSTKIHIMTIFSGNSTARAIAEANSGINIRFLRKMMRYWGTFHWMVENIRAQYRSAMVASRSGKLTGDGDAVSLLDQYGDWFSKYPHGVSDGDFPDPDLNKMKEKGGDAVLEQKPELQSVEDFFTTLSPPPTIRAKETQRGHSSKRLRTMRRLSEAYTGPILNGRESLKPETGAQVVDGYLGTNQDPLSRQQPPQPKRQQQQQASRRFSVPLGGQTSGTATFEPLGMPQVQPQLYSSVTSASPGTGQNFVQQQRQQPEPPPQSSIQHPFFPVDMLTMNAPQQQLRMNGGFAQPLDRQNSFSAFSVDSADGSAMADRSMSPIGQNPLAPGAMSSYMGQDASGWLIPLVMNDSESSHRMDVGGSAITTQFSNPFGMTPNQLDALQHNL